MFYAVFCDVFYDPVMMYDQLYDVYDAFYDI